MNQVSVRHWQVKGQNFSSAVMRSRTVRPKMLGRLSSENVCGTADLRDQCQGTFHWVIPGSVLSQTTVYLSVPASQEIKSR